MPRNYGRSFSSQNLKGENDSSPYKGSRISLYSNPEDREEIFRLRNYLETYESKINQLQEQIDSKQRQLEQNQTVCAAFEQQLQKFRVSSPETKESTSETNITDQDAAEALAGAIVAEMKPPTTPTAMEPVIPVGSMTSISSHTSNSSSNSSEELRKRTDRKNWRLQKAQSTISEPTSSMSFESSLGRKSSVRRQLRDSFRSAFGKGRPSKYPSASRSTCGDTLGIIDDDESMNTSITESIEDLKSVLKEKDLRLKESDRRLTDIRLAALSYQHEMDQLREELQALREERDVLRNSNGSICQRSVLTNGTMSSNKHSSDSDDNKVIVFLESFDTEKRIIGHVNLDNVEEVEAEIYEVFVDYLKQLDEKSLGLTTQSIIRTELQNGCACVYVSSSAAIALNEAIHLTKASQIFESAIESRRILISGTAADSKNDFARRIAQIFACQELSVERAADIPTHSIKTAGIVKGLEGLERLFEPLSDEPEAEQDRPIILIVDLGLVDQTDLVKTLRSRGKTPIVVAIGKENEITPQCAEVFHVVQMACGGSDLAMKLRMKYVNDVVVNGPVKARRSVNNQIKFLENLHEKINMMLITYQNSHSKIGAAWYENCPWAAAEFQTWFVRLWNQRLRPYLSAAIIEGVKQYGDKGQDWFDIVNWVKNNYDWKNDFVFDHLSAADCGLRRIDSDPLLLMLQRLEFASKLVSMDVEPSDYSLPAPLY